MAFAPGWDEPHVARFYEHLASQSRLILFDARGTGMSDKVSVRELHGHQARVGAILGVIPRALPLLTEAARLFDDKGHIRGAAETRALIAELEFPTAPT